MVAERLVWRRRKSPCICFIDKGNFFFWSGHYGDVRFIPAALEYHQKALSLRQELEIWPHCDSQRLSETPPSLQTRGQAAGDTVPRRRKDGPKNFPVSVSLMPAQSCPQPTALSLGRSRGRPSAGLLGMGTAGENPILIPLGGVRKTRNQEHKLASHDMPDTAAVGRYDLPQPGLREMLYCVGASTVQAVTASTQGWQTASAAELATLSHQHWRDLWIKQLWTTVILSLLGNRY